MDVTSTVFGGATGGEEYVGEVVGLVGLGGVGAATAAVGGATSGEVGTAVACPNIFDMRLVSIPIMAEYTPLQEKKPAQLFRTQKSFLLRWSFYCANCAVLVNKPLTNV